VIAALILFKIFISLILCILEFKKAFINKFLKYKIKKNTDTKNDAGQTTSGLNPNIAKNIKAIAGKVLKKE
jgi:hypothetical protein